MLLPGDHLDQINEKAENERKARHAELIGDQCLASLLRTEEQQIQEFATKVFFVIRLR